MENSGKKEYKYFAFISYCHKDIKEAERLEEILNDFKLPVHIQKEHPELPEKFKGVCRDNTCMNACGNLAEEIERHLEESEYLIVVCSPDAVESEWVEKEINYFIKIRDKEYIYPFVLCGVVNAVYSEKECIPKPLLPFSGRAANVSTYSFEHAVIEIIAGIIGVNVDEIWQHHVRIEEEKKRQLKEQNDKLLVAQSRFVAEKSMGLADEDSYLARLLALEVLPEDLEKPNRPYTAEAEAALRKAVGRNCAVFKGHAGAINSVAVSSDGNMIVSASCDKTIRIWEILTGKEIHKLEGHEKEVLFADFSPDNKQIVSTSRDGTIRVWDIETGNELFVLADDFYQDSYKPISFSNDGKKIVSASSKDRGCSMHIDFSHPELVEASLGNCISFSTYTNSVCVWDAESGKELKPQTSLEVNVDTIAVSPSGDLVVSIISDSNRIVIWDLSSGKELKRLIGHTSYVTSAVFSTDGKLVVSTSLDGTIRIWDVKTGNQLQVIKNEDKLITAAFSPFGNCVISTSNYGRTIRIWDVGTGNQLRAIDATEEGSSAVFCLDGTCIVSASHEQDVNTIRLWDNNVQIGYGTGSGEEYNPNCVYSQDERQAAIIENRNEFETGDDLVIANPFHINVYDVNSKQKRVTLSGHNRNVNSAVFSPDGKFIVSASEDTTVRVWDAETGVEWKKLMGHSAGANSAVFSSDGTKVVSTSLDRTIRIWDLNNEQVMVIEGHLSDVFYAAFSPDNKYIVSVSSDNTISVWEVGSGKEVERFVVNTSNVWKVGFYSDGNRIVATTINGSSLIFEFSPLQKLINKTRDRFKNRLLTIEERKRYYLEW